MSAYTDMLIEALEFEEFSGPWYGKNGHIFTGVSSDDITTNDDGPIGQCLEFTDGAAKLRILNAAMGSFQIGTGSQSVEFWTYIDAIPASGFRGFYVTGGANNSDEGINIALNAASDTVRVNLSNGTTRTIVDANSSVLSDATWHHIVAIVDRDLDEVRIYVDGVEEGSGSISGFSSDDIQSGNNLDINGDFTGPNTGIDGRLDHFRVYDDVLSTSQITYLYNGGDGRSYYELADLSEVYYPLTHKSDVRGHAWAELTETGSPSFSASGVALSGTSERLTNESKIFRNVEDETFCLWGTFTPDTIGTAMGICGQNSSQYSVRVLGGGSPGVLQFRLNTSDGVKTVNWGTTLVAGTEYFFYAYHDKDSDVIGLAVDDGTPVTTATSAGVPVQGASNFTIGSIATSNHFDGTIKNVGFRRGGLLSASEETHFAGGGDFDTELEKDYTPANGAKQARVKAKAAQIGGTGTQDCLVLTMDESSLPNELHDSDEPTAEITGASIRVSTDEAGANMVPCYVHKFTASSGGGTVEIKLNPGTLDGTSGTDVYIWWLSPGHSATPPPLAHAYGRNSVTDDGFLHYLLMDDDPSGSVTDITGNGQDPSSIGSMTSGDVVAGKIGDALDFDGTDDGLQIAATPLFPDPSSDFAVGAWVKPTDQAGSGFPSIAGMRHNHSGSFQGMFFDYQDSTDKFRFVVRDNGTSSTKVNSSAASTTSVSYGSWQHVLGRFDESAFESEIFVNGTSEDTDIGSGNSGDRFVIGSAAYTIGHGRFATTNVDFYEGQIDEVWLYEGTISADQITTLYNNQNAPGTFWDSTAAVTTPGAAAAVTSIVAYDAGLTFAAVSQKNALAVTAHDSGVESANTAQKNALAVSAHDAGLEYSALAAKAALALIGYDAGFTYTNTGQKDASAQSGVLAHAAGFTYSNTAQKKALASISHDAGLTASAQASKAAASVLAHAAGFTYAAISGNPNLIPVCLALSIEHINKLSLSIEK